MKKLIAIAILSVGCLMMTGCGGSSSDNGVVFEGFLDQGSDSGHSAKVNPRHSAGERIEEVDICAFGECSKTDAQGQWGFLVNSFKGGEVLFSAVGHGIDDTFVVEIPESAKDVMLHLQNNGGQVGVHHMTVNGQPFSSESAHTHSEEESHSHAEGEAHSHE